MTTAADTPAAELTAINQINTAVQQLQGQLRSQQDVIEQQRGEIARLQTKIEELLDILENFYKLHGLEAQPIKVEQIKQMDAHGISGEEFLAEVQRLFGK